MAYNPPTLGTNKSFISNQSKNKSDHQTKNSEKTGSFHTIGVTHQPTSSDRQS